MGGLTREMTTRDCRRAAILRSRSRFLFSLEGADACVLRDRQTQHADDHQFLCDWRESFPELAFYLSARLGTSWPGVFHQPGCDNQFLVALRVDAAATCAGWKRDSC